MNKTVKFIPQLTELIKNGSKTTTWRLFDDKELTVGDTLKLATRDGEKVTEFGKAIITKVSIRTISTLKPEDYVGHEPSIDPLSEYREYYGDKVQEDTEVKVIKFKVLEITKK